VETRRRASIISKWLSDQFRLSAASEARLPERKMRALDARESGTDASMNHHLPGSSRAPAKVAQRANRLRLATASSLAISRTISSRWSPGAPS